MAEPLVVITHCPVCGKRHDPSVIVLDDRSDAVLSNETCESCWQWFRMEEFCLVIVSSGAFGSEWCGPKFNGEVANVQRTT